LHGVARRGGRGLELIGELIAKRKDEAEQEGDKSRRMNERTKMRRGHFTLAHRAICLIGFARPPMNKYGLDFLLLAIIWLNILKSYFLNRIKEIKFEQTFQDETETLNRFRNERKFDLRSKVRNYVILELRHDIK